MAGKCCTVKSQQWTYTAASNCDNKSSSKHLNICCEWVYGLAALSSSCSPKSLSSNMILMSPNLSELSQLKPWLLGRPSLSKFAVYFHPGLTAGTQYTYWINYWSCLSRNNRITSEPIIQFIPTSGCHWLQSILPTYTRVLLYSMSYTVYSVIFHLIYIVIVVLVDDPRWQDVVFYFTW